MARSAAGTSPLSDILAGQPADARALAEIYDLEHDAIVEDLPFYTELARREGPEVLDLGCGSGRLFLAWIAAGATRVVGVDGSPALLERAEARVGRHPDLAAARAAGVIELVRGDVRDPGIHGAFGLVVLAGVISHLDGPREGLRALVAARERARPGGAVVVDLLGPGALPDRDLPPSVDWELPSDAGRIVRRSQLTVARAADGLRVEYVTQTDREEAGGTISRLPARFRLWYPSLSGLFDIAEEADLDVDVTFGSYDLDPLDDSSERCIVVMRRPSVTPGRG